MADPLWSSAEIVATTGGRPFGADFVADGVAIDTRELAPGDLFVALAGARDGHDFALRALEEGAAGLLTTRTTPGSGVVVDETLAGLRRLAAAARERAGGARRGAVTGSVGKTSVTQLVRAGLERAGDAHGSVRSFNNHIGVPLTLARMPRATRRAVFEIGMNHAGEIGPLSRLVAPHAVAITTVEAAHVEAFADGEAGVARAKAEIFEGLVPGGEAILNLDNRWFGTLKDQALGRGGRPRTFGWAPGADARLVSHAVIDGGAAIEAVIDGAPIAFRVRQSAAHWGPMSLCALLMMRALGLGLATGVAACEAFAPLEGRGAERRVEGAAGAFTLIDESYNASPVSVAAALRALGGRPGRRLAVLTDMLELGEGAEESHAGLAREVEASDIDLVFCAGPLMEALWRSLPPGRRGAWTPDAVALAPEVALAVRAGDVVMVKGSKASNAALVLKTLERA